MEWRNLPDVDGPDYDPDNGKYGEYKGILTDVREHPELSAEERLRRLDHLKAEIIPFWHRWAGIEQKEKEDFMAVFLKYNGSDGIKTRLAEDYDEMEARTTDRGDYKLIEMMNCRYGTPSLRARKQSFLYDNRSYIEYDIEPDSKNNHRKGTRQSDRAKAIEDEQAHPKPPFNVHILEPEITEPHHNNANDEDNLDLKLPLLRIIHRLMNHKDAWPFMNRVDETIAEDYFTIIKRPRHFKFIEQKLRTENWYGYGATAFFNDMLLVFHNCRMYNGPDSQYTKYADKLERLMKKLLREIEGIGMQLLTQYNAIVHIGPEDWPDPGWSSRQPGFKRHLPGIDRGVPDIGRDALLKEEVERCQARILQLQYLLGTKSSGTRTSTEERVVEGRTQPKGGSLKRPRDEDTEATGDCRKNGDKRRRLTAGGTSDPITSNAVPLQRNARKQPVSMGQVEAGPSGSAGNAPDSSRGRQKRAKIPEDDESDDNDGLEAGEGYGPTAPKRQRLEKSRPSARMATSSPQAADPEPVVPASRVPKAVSPILDSEQNLSPAAGPSSPRARGLSSPSVEPSSQPLGFSRNTVTMSKIAKMGKRRPWLFGYSTAEGYGIYAFVECPASGCKHHFSSHPLRQGRAQDHISDCNQPLLDERDIVKQYARQVIKDRGRKSDLTIDWARRSNLNLLPSHLKKDHPENFPHAPASE
ncbi:hypothetical protein J7T55_010575 [Diaporthe amygdali]|uniref:uncharacterized protein n=1 Tax=Phomopsis amygdali TaxID=1214568 RepID=UPI0022FE739E|nr:uncharacterized protein J7T55_010575 [Diaporthe amygdali]KAJ0115752.1 hypothetical protein J7T55_010575 [Diaporthe amygdali]